MSPLAKLIETLLLKGCTRHLVEEAIVQEWKEGPSPSKEQIDAGYAECVEAWIDNATKESPDAIRAYHIRLRKYLYQKSMQINDFKSCLAILGDLAKLQHQYAHQVNRKKENQKEESEVNRYLRVIHDKSGRR